VGERSHAYVKGFVDNFVAWVQKHKK